MKKNVFQGFSEFELKKLELVNGGIEYRGTYNGSSQVDEEAITAKGEADPWHGNEIQPYNAIDATWNDCSGLADNPSGTGTIAVNPSRSR